MHLSGPDWTAVLLDRILFTRRKVYNKTIPPQVGNVAKLPFRDFCAGQDTIEVIIGRGSGVAVCRCDRGCEM